MSAGSGQLTNLRCGEEVTFGFCLCGTCLFDVRLDSSGVYGVLRAERDVCWLTNTSPRVTLVVWDLEDPQQRLRVGPGRPPTPLPFELAEVGVLGAGQSAIATVFGPDPESETHMTPSRCAGRTEDVSLDPNATYFAVLRALCAAKRSTGNGRLPTSAEIADMLGHEGIVISSRAVDHHVDYLIRRFDLDVVAVGPHGRAWRRREALVDLAVDRGLVGS